MPHPHAIASAAPGNAGQSLPCRAVSPAFTSVNESLALANQVTCFQRPEGTQRKELLCKLHKPKGMQNHPPRGGYTPSAKNLLQTLQLLRSNLTRVIFLVLVLDLRVKPPRFRRLRRLI